MAAGDDTTTVDLEAGECALVVGEDDGALTLRIVAAADVPTDGPDLPVAPEIVLALAKRLRTDPDFQDEVLDWYYAHEDKDGEDEPDDEEEN